MSLNKQQLREILEELYSLDAGLRAKEKELIKIITEMSASRPDVKFDEQFISRLRAQIMERAGADSSLPFITINFTPMKKLIYAVSGAALAIIIIIPAFYFYSQQAKNSTGKIAKKIPILAINKIGAKSFGSLISQADSLGKTGAPISSSGENMSNSLAGTATSPLAFGRGGGGGGNGSADAKIMPPFPMANYRYVYKGDKMPEVAAQMEVLKRIKSAPTNVNMGDLVNGLNFGLADLGTFSNLNLQSVAFTQKGDFSYSLNVMPEEGVISITQNWLDWPAGKCGSDMKCAEVQQKLSEADMLSSEELFKIGNQFLAEHGIDKKFYADPIVSYDWRTAYDIYPDKANFYFPNNLDIIYPLKINDKIVYEEYSGQPQGLNVSIDIKNKKVAGLYNLTTQNYDSSSYDMETDSKNILAYAERGGINNIYYAQNGANIKDVELELSDPELNYIKYYNYESGKNLELLVPALVFKVINPPKDQPYFRQAVVVPLAKEILAERQRQSQPISSDVGGGASTEVAAPEPVLLERKSVK